MLRIVESGVDPIDSYSRWWLVKWAEPNSWGESEQRGQFRVKSSIAHCCTLAAIQNVYLTYGSDDAERMFKQIHTFVSNFDKYRQEAEGQVPDIVNPLWRMKTFVYFHSHEGLINAIQKAIPNAKVVHSFQNTAHTPYNTVHQVMFTI